MEDNNAELEEVMEDLIEKLPDNNEIAGVKTHKDEETGEISLQGDNSPYRETYFTNIIYEEKEFVRFVKAVERMVRNSNEYKAYIGFLKNDMELNQCSFLNNVDHDMADIEFHHYPFTLYDIVSIIMEDMMMKGENVNTFRVSKKVIQHHYDHIIGLVPVSVSVHELIHSGEIFVNLNQVFGDYYKFIKLYKDTMNPKLKEDFNKLVQLSQKNVKYSDKDILKIKK